MLRSRSKIFDWIRAVSAAAVPLAVKGTALELIPLIDNATLTSDLSISQAARSLSADARTVRRHRRALIDAGLLANVNGWRLTVNTEHLTPVKCGRTEHVLPVKYGRTEHMSPDNNDRSNIITALIGSRSDLRAREKQPSQTQALSDLPSKWQPAIQNRKPTNPTGAEQLERAWSLATGAPFQWPNWSAVVAPYLTAEELAELAEVGARAQTPNLPFLAAVASRIIRDSNKPKTQRRQTAYNSRARSRRLHTCNGTLDALSGYSGEPEP